MRVCGVELKGSEAIFVVLEHDGNEVHWIDVRPPKLKFGESEDQQSAAGFLAAVEGFVRDNRIDRIAIKQRAKSGPFAGGPVTFKMEALLQLAKGAQTRLFTGQALGADQRKRVETPPAGLQGYREEAFRVASYAIRSWPE